MIVKIPEHPTERAGKTLQDYLVRKVTVINKHK